MSDPSACNENEKFDPYHQWLGISKAEQPPNYYRLLAVEPFESNLAVIDAAALRQMLFLKQYAAGPHSQKSQELLNEVSDAQLCLLDKDKKRQYDRQLKQRLAPKTPEQSAPVADFSISNARVESVSARVRGKSRNEMTSVVVYTALAGLLILGTYLFVWKTGGSVEQSAPENSVASTPAESQPRKGLDASERSSAKQKPTPKPRERVVIPPPLKKGQIDVLDEIDSNSAMIQGDWVILNRTVEMAISSKSKDTRSVGIGRRLVSPNVADALCQFTVKPTTDYELELTVTRKSGDDYLLLGLSMADTQFPVLIDAKRGRVAGVEGLEGGAAESNSSTKQISLLQDNKPHKIVCKVSQSELTISCDGNAVISLTDGYVQRLNPLDDRFSAIDEGVLFIGSNSSIFHIDRVIYTPTSSGEKPLKVTESEKESPETTSQTAPPPQRKPIPSIADQKQAEKQLRESLKTDFSAETTEERLALVDELLRRERETEDVTEKYVLLSLAREKSIEIGSIPLSMTAVQRLTENYEVEPVAIKYETLNQLNTSLRDNVEKSRALLVSVVALAEEALEADEIPVAEKISSLSMALSRKFGTATAKQEAINLQKRVLDTKQKFESIKAARKTLEESPDDPHANQRLGEYLAFAKQDWDQGIIHLAKGSDKRLRDVAQQELANPLSADEIVAVAEAWWSTTRSLRIRDRDNAKFRARVWYEKAIPKLKGVAKIKIQKRIDRINEIETKKFKDKPAELDVPYRSAFRLQNSASWSGIPEELTTASIYYYSTSNAPSGIEGGVAHFRIKRSGLVYLAASWERDGVSGPWQSQVASPQQLQAAGWQPLGATITRFGDEPYVIFVKFCITGENYSIRTRKYGPPYVIVGN